MSKHSKIAIVAVTAVVLVTTIALAEKAETLLCGTDVFAATVTNDKTSAVDACCAKGETATTKTFATSPSEPLVCSLGDTQKIERRDEIRAMLSQAAQAVEENETGYTITFADGHGKEIVEFIELERDCCTFFHFTLDFGPNQGPVTLSITGPPGAKDFLAPLMASMGKES